MIDNGIIITFQILLASAYYNIPWVVEAVRKAVINYCTQSNEPNKCANRCRDILLILQENVTYSIDQPNPSYTPFDPCLQPLTDELIARLQNYASSHGVIPNELEPARIANLVFDNLNAEPENRIISRDDSMMTYIAFYYSDIDGIGLNDIFEGIMRRNSVLQNLLIGMIPDMAAQANRQAVENASQLGYELYIAEYTILVLIMTCETFAHDS